MNRKSRQFRYGFIFFLHVIVFIILYLFHINAKYYGFESFLRIQPFELEDHNGEKFTEKDLGGKFHFLYFGFLHCTEVCPKGVSLLTRIAKQISDPDLRFVFVSIDPARDTKESLNTFIQNRDKRFIGLRDFEIRKIENFAGEFNLQFARELFSKNNSAYNINHSSVIILLNKSLTKVIQYPEGLDYLDRIQKDFEKFKSNSD